MVKRLFLACLLTGGTAALIGLQARHATERDKRMLTTIEQALTQLPDSAFGKVAVQNLLDDKIYVQLKKEGWSQQEIEAIMNAALRDRQRAKGLAGYMEYAKEWLPYQRLGVNADGSEPYSPTAASSNSSEAAQADGSTDDGTNTDDMISDGNMDRYDNDDTPITDPDATLSTDQFYNKTWPEIDYTPDDRLAGRRNPGYWRPVKHKPSSGRVLWATVHPEDPDKIMFIGDGAGIWRTDDGRNWRNITDNIPERNWRYTSFHSAIPVDPDDWNHVFAFMNVSARGGATSVWETKDGGTTWRKIQGASHGFFKRGYCFRDAEGKLKFIGAVRENWSTYPGRTHNRLLISEDTCKTWTNLKDQLTTADGMDLRDDIPASMSANGTHGLWFQQMEFDPKDRNRIYIPTSRSILYFDDGAKSTLVNGKLRYNLKKMRVRVHGRTLDTPVLNEAEPYNFPVPANAVGHMVIDPENPNRMWYATGDQWNNTALYFTENRGEDWITLYDRWKGIGRTTSNDTGVFGNEVAWVWLGGFGVNLKDNRYLYGTSQSSAYSETDWPNGEEVVYNKFHWGGAMTAQHDDGNYYLVSNARHQADNHFMLSHKSGRVYRGCDGGLLIIDPTVNNRRWTNIGNNANEMCNYRVQCNEFGDQVLISNTQDIDIQTYRYGRWGLWHGYEGSNSCINPYANTGYWSGSGGLQGLDPNVYSGNSWASVITRADVVNNTFYMLNTTNNDGMKLSRWDDLGRGGTGLDAALGGTPDLYNWGLCRDKGRCTIYALIGGRLRRSVDQGATFEDVLYNGAPAQFSGTLALDPDNSDIIYIGKRGCVERYNLVNGTKEVLTQNGLPNIDCGNLLFHEGTGDLYFCNGSDGIYYLRNGASAWKFWLKGYNTNHGNSQVINYTTQEMYQCDYGRGVYAADLERPADRYFRRGFGLKELTNNDGIKTIGIDTYWTIPLYYRYRWTVNGQDVNNPYQYLTARLQPGDRVQLTLTLRESPDVSTASAVYTVTETPGAEGENGGTAAATTASGANPGAATNSTVLRAVSPQLSAGSTGGTGSTGYAGTTGSAASPNTALYSDGRGRVDLGFTDLFLDDWTVDLWVKPETDGCIIGNRQRDDHLGAKGWVLCIEGGTLKFKYSPRHRFHAPHYEQGDYESIYDFDCGRHAMGQWHHVAVSHSRNGQILVYVDGNLSGQSDRRQPEASLNSSLPLSLFGDGIDRYPLRGTVDELKVWNRALSRDEVRAEMFSTNATASTDLRLHYDFNGAQLADCRETFGGYRPLSRIRAVTSPAPGNLPLCARTAVIVTATAADSTVAGRLLTLRTSRQQDINLGVYAYDTRQWKRPDDNLLERYYDLRPTAYLLHSFDAVDAAERADLTFKPADMPFDAATKYRLYWSESDSEQPFWNLVGELGYDAATGNLQLPDAPLGQLLDKKLLIVAPKPALEATILGVNTKGVYEVCSPDQTTVTVEVRTLQNLDEPLTGYELESDNGLLLPQGKLEFKQGVARVDMRIDMSRLPRRGDVATATLRGSGSDLMIPLTLSVANRITDADPGNCLTINGGAAQFGDRYTFQSMEGSRHITVAAWVRIDDPAWAAGGGNMQFLWFSSGWGFMSKGGWTRFRCGGYIDKDAYWPINAANAGQWVHMAYTLDGNTIAIYINGHKTSEFGYTGADFTTNSGLWMGAPTGGFNYFKGAFDQVAVWNRALSQQEIVHCMQNRVTLDSPQLVSYLTMDQTDDSGRLVDMLSGYTVSTNGNVQTGQRSTMPYNPDRQTDGTAGAMQLTYPAGKTRPTVVSTFSGQSVNYLPADNTEIIPLNREHYTVAFDAPGNVAANDQVQLLYTHPTVRAGEAVRLGIRAFGGVNAPYSTFVQATEVADGSARFTLPFSQLSNSAELMMFMPRTDELRAAQVSASVDDAALSVTDGRIRLRDSDTSIPVTLRLLSGQLSQPVSVYVHESQYATPSVQTVDFGGGETVRFNIDIDRSRLDDKALNPVTVSFPGLDGAEVKFEVYLEPKVTLRLRNGNGANSFTALSPIADLDIEAKLEHGWLDRPVELEITADAASTTSIGAGTLLANNAVRITGMRHYSSFQTEAVEGWNLIGNPYMANINLTKSHNVSYDPAKVTKFVYSFNPETGNYEAYDMTRYDQRHAIKPFESYFVQTMADDAELTVTPVATEASPTKRTQAMPLQESFAKLELLVDGRLADRAAIFWDGGATEAFVINEDAPKFWSINPNANQLCFMAADRAMPLSADEQGTATSISYERQFYGASTLGMKIATPGRVQIRLSEVSGDIMGQEFYLQDRRTGQYYVLMPGGEPVDVPLISAGQLDTRYALLRDDPTVTRLDDVRRDSPYRVDTGLNSITVSGLQGDATVSVYKPNGILVASQHTADGSFKLTLTAGLYIVKIYENDTEYAVKVGVK